MSTKNYHYEPGAVHKDKHREINITGNVTGESLSGMIAAFMKEDDEEAQVLEPAAQPEQVAAQGAGQVSFAARVKDIVQLAATRNGQRIESHAKGHERSYIFRIDAEAFGKAMDDLLEQHADKLKEFLGGTLDSTQVTKVCFFIGHVVDMHLINDESLQMTDLLFAFEDYYPSLQTVKTKLSVKECSPSQKVLLGTFEGLLRRHKKRE